MDKKKLNDIQEAANKIIQQTTFLVNMSRIRVNSIREQAELIKELTASLGSEDE